ncbi:MAG TPA: response regulator transcription factor [Vicinamibacterales bacterium]
MKPRVLLADDHRLLVEAFAKLLESECEIVGHVGDGLALLEAAPKLKPDVVVLDVAMPLLNGLDAGRKLKERMPDVRLIFVTMNEDPDLAVQAFRIGASGYLLKRSAGSELLLAIREVMERRHYVTPFVTKDLVGSFINSLDQAGTRRSLTPRQREVLQLLAEGRSMKEAATILNVSVRTIAFHKYRMMEQLDIKTTAELVQFAVKEHLV